MADLTDAIHTAGCNVEESRMSILGGEFAVIMMVSGAWNNLAKLEDALRPLQERLEMVITSKRTEDRALTEQSIP